MKCKHENKNGTCGLKGSYACRHKCFTEDLCKCFEPISNADRIRGMNDEEMAGFIDDIQNDAFAADGCGYSLHFPDDKETTWIDWLRQPAEEANNGQGI